MRNAYMVHYPRNFCNEYTVHVGSPEILNQLAKILECLPRSENGDVRRITRQRAIYLGWTRVREAKKCGEQWFGGFAETGNSFAETLNEAIVDAAKATEAAIDEFESMAERVNCEHA